MTSAFAALKILGCTRSRVKDGGPEQCGRTFSKEEGRYNSSVKPKEQAENMLGVPSFPAKASPQRQGSGRNKIALKRGRSLMDWVKLANSGQDLQGFMGRTNSVTLDELRKHNKEDDCWMAIRGRVYNVTKYMEYHPGGVDELMRGAGMDATDLFDEVHKWVNYSSMLAKCYIGPLQVTSTSSIKKTSPTTNNSFLSPARLTATKPAEVIPRYDWYEKENELFLSIYTKSKVVHSSDVIVDCSDGKKLDIKVLFGEKYYRIHLDLTERVASVAIKAVTGNKIDILLQKKDRSNSWKQLGVGLEGHNKLHQESQRELIFRKCKILSILNVTHDIKLYHLAFPENVQYETPIGHHVIVKDTVEGMEISRSYTVVSPSLAEPIDNKTLYLMIKHYPDGTLTPNLKALNEGDHMVVSDSTGNFKRTRLKDAANVYLIAAGTGFTPMIRLINIYLHGDELNNSSGVKLLFANKTEEDIIWKDQLDNLAQKLPDRFSVQYVLSGPSEKWTGLKGRVDKDMLKEFSTSDWSAVSNQQSPVIQRVEALSGLDQLFAICGPDEFTATVKSLLLQLEIKEESIHCFLG